MQPLCAIRLLAAAAVLEPADALAHGLRSVRLNRRAVVPALLPLAAPLAAEASGKSRSDGVRPDMQQHGMASENASVEGRKRVFRDRLRHVR